MFLLVGILLAYSLAVFVFFLLWKAPAYSPQTNLDFSASVLVPFRDEENSLKELVEILSDQRDVDFEVIFIDDHSTDNSLTVLREALVKAKFRWKLIELEDKSGKKAALAEGVENASHDLIVTTDADCKMAPLWLQSVMATFQNPSIQMALSPIMFSGNTPWQLLQSIEYSPLIGITRVLAEQGRPIMANGGNLAYRKFAFEEVGGFKGIDGTPSGDDELLMNKIVNKYPEGVVFQSTKDALVTTDAMPDWKSFLNQRLRWASKWREGKRPGTMFTAVSVFVVQLATILAVICLFLQLQNSLWIVAALVCKFLFEYLFIKRIRKAYAFGTPIHFFLLCFILYPFYGIYFGIAANFKKFEWKGRKYPSIVKQ